MNYTLPDPQGQLLTAIAAFCEMHNFSKSAFGEKALNDPGFVFDLEQGRECRRATLRKVQSFMNDYVVDGAP